MAGEELDDPDHDLSDLSVCSRCENAKRVLSQHLSRDTAKQFVPKPWALRRTGVKQAKPGIHPFRARAVCPLHCTIARSIYNRKHFSSSHVNTAYEGTYININTTFILIFTVNVHYISGQW